MKITIDTKEESKEELKKIINFLQKILEESNYSTYSSTPTNSSHSPSQPTQGMFSMFNNEPSTVEPTNMFSDTPPTSNIFSDNQPSPQTITRKEELTDYANNPYKKEGDQPFNVREMLEEY